MLFTGNTTESLVLWLMCLIKKNNKKAGTEQRNNEQKIALYPCYLKPGTQDTASPSAGMRSLKCKTCAAKPTWMSHPSREAPTQHGWQFWWILLGLDLCHFWSEQWTPESRDRDQGEAKYIWGISIWNRDGIKTSDLFLSSKMSMLP